MKILKIKHLILTLVFFSFLSCANDEDGIYQTNSNENHLVHVDYSTIENEILVLVNDHRKSLGLNSLIRLDLASYKADDHTNYMIEVGAISHDNFNERFDFLVKHANAKSVAENVAFGYPCSNSVVKAWMNSDSHRKNIENPNFTHFGISTKCNNSERNYFTQIFIKK